jgi:hypothetical protein
VTTFTAPAGLVALQAPIPSPRQYDLLAAATLVDPTSNRWLGGGWSGGDVPGPAYTHDPCSSGTDRVKASAGDIAQQMEATFNVYLTGFCTAQSVGPNPTFFTDRLKLAFQVYEAAAVERVLATGDGHSTLGPYLGDLNMEDLTPGGGAASALRALELLETEIARNGTGIIHAAPATATAWVAQNLIMPVRNVMQTKLGTPVAVGAGYIGVYPDGQAAPAADQEWAFASGPIEIYRGEIETVPDTYAQAFDRALNDVLFIAERPYLFNWIARQDAADDDHVQAGVLIDLVP